MYYKFGVDKLLLRTGKLVGLVAAALLFGQLLLAGRIKALDRIFSLPALYRVHRLAAAALAAAALIHPALVLTADDMIMIPLQGRYWPEWVGAALVVLVLLQAVISRWRRLFHLPYHWWQRLHRLVGIAATAALVVHVFYASETFQTQGPPRTALFVFAVGWLMLWIRVRWRASGPGRRRWTVSRIAAAGKDACAVTLTPAGRRPFSYAPGQFAFVSIRSRPSFQMAIS